MLVFVPKMSELCSIIQSCCCRGGEGVLFSLVNCLHFVQKIVNTCACNINKIELV